MLGSARQRTRASHMSALAFIYRPMMLLLYVIRRLHTHKSIQSFAVAQKTVNLICFVPRSLIEFSSPDGRIVGWDNVPCYYMQYVRSHKLDR